MKKTQLTLVDVTESGFKLLEVLMERLTVGQISIRIGFSHTTIRRLLQRLEVFGLVEEELIDQVKHFTLTKGGRSFVKRIQKTKPKSDKTEQSKKKVIEEQPVDVKIIEHQEPVREPLNLTVWLRQKAQGLRILADELTAMADDLSIYEE